MSSRQSRRDALRVTFVTPGFPPALGGVEEHCGQIASQLARGGDRVSALTSSRTDRGGTRLQADGIVVRTYRASRVRTMSLSARLSAAALASRPQNADILHVHSYHSSAGLAALAGFWRPVVFTPHFHGVGHTGVARVLHRGYQWVGRALFRAADAIICVSEAEKRQLLQAFPGAAGRVYVIPNGVDVEPIQRAAPWAGEPPTVLVLGRLEPYKRVAAVVAAIASVPKSAQLVVVGTGSQADDLQTLAREYGVADRVRLLGALDTASVHRWMRTAAVLVSMSEHEAFGMVPLEAAAAGAAVVLSDIPAHREITDKYLGRAAHLLPPGSSEREIAAAITEELAATRLAVVTVPLWPEIAVATRDVYSRVLRSRSHRGRRDKRHKDRPADKGLRDGL